MNEEDRKACERADFLSELLREFGARLGGFDPGVMAYLPNKSGTPIGFDRAEWAWLEPLLAELRDYRRGRASKPEECK